MHSPAKNSITITRAFGYALFLYPKTNARRNSTGQKQFMNLAGRERRGQGGKNVNHSYQRTGNHRGYVPSFRRSGRRRRRNRRTGSRRSRSIGVLRLTKSLLNKNTCKKDNNMINYIYYLASERIKWEKESECSTKSAASRTSP